MFEIYMESLASFWGALVWRNIFRENKFYNESLRVKFFPNPYYHNRVSAEIFVIQVVVGGIV